MKNLTSKGTVPSLSYKVGDIVWDITGEEHKILEIDCQTEPGSLILWTCRLKDGVRFGIDNTEGNFTLVFAQQKTSK